MIRHLPCQIHNRAATAATVAHMQYLVERDSMCYSFIMKNLVFIMIILLATIVFTHLHCARVVQLEIAIFILVKVVTTRMHKAALKIIPFLLKVLSVTNPQGSF